MSVDRQIFDILGVGSREDTYTDLIKYAFDCDPGFRKRLLARLELPDCSGEWRAYVRMPVVVAEGRKKDVPDLVLVNASKRHAAIIENKTFSDEGWRQTERYASDKFRRNLAKHLGIPGLSLSYFYLTLDGTKPACEKFTPLKYRDVGEIIPKRENPSGNLEILLQEFRERVMQYESWPTLSESDIVLDYLKHGEGFVSWSRTFEILTRAAWKTEFRSNLGQTANAGCGVIPLCQWWKDEWLGAKWRRGVPGDRCFNIHYELQWNTREDVENLALMVHYESRPYMTRTELEKKPRAFLESFRKTRDLFFDAVAEAGAATEAVGWQLKKSHLQIARHTFTPVASFREFHQAFSRLVAAMTPQIDRASRAILHR